MMRAASAAQMTCEGTACHCACTASNAAHSTLTTTASSKSPPCKRPRHVVTSSSPSTAIATASAA